MCHLKIYAETHCITLTDNFICIGSVGNSSEVYYILSLTLRRGWTYWIHINQVWSTFAEGLMCSQLNLLLILIFQTLKAILGFQESFQMTDGVICCFPAIIIPWSSSCLLQQTSLLPLPLSFLFCFLQIWNKTTLFGLKIPLAEMKGNHLHPNCTMLCWAEIQISKVVLPCRQD